ncbi:hypothetical protein BIWAKO_01097 [Bosea sp. BIWAKO-01]|nr:hypothetical protein BIWAKO_01097 [Bosea sp. BIWAKO-01]
MRADGRCHDLTETAQQNARTSESASHQIGPPPASSDIVADAARRPDTWLRMSRQHAPVLVAF